MKALNASSELYTLLRERGGILNVGDFRFAVTEHPVGENPSGCSQSVASGTAGSTKAPSTPIGYHIRTLSVVFYR